MEYRKKAIYYQETEVYSCSYSFYNKNKLNQISCYRDLPPKTLCCRPGYVDFNMAATGRRTRKRKPQDSGMSFAAGFRLPTLKQSKNAIGLSKIPKIFEPGPENAYFQRIPHPNSVDDWLAQYNEEGQTFKNFFRTCPWISGRKVKYTKQTFAPEGKNIKERYPDGKIYILPIGDFDESVSNCNPCIDDLTDYTERFYSLPVVVLPTVKLKLPSKKGTENPDRRMHTYYLGQIITHLSFRQAFFL